MLMGLECIELVMFRGWLEVLSCTDQNTWDGSVVDVHTFCVFLVVLHEEQMSAFT